MMADVAEPTTEDVCRRILASSSQYVEISELAASSYVEATGQSPLLAAEWAESNLERILKSLEKRRQRDLKRGVPAQFEIARSGASEYVRLLDIRTVSGEKQPRDVLQHARALLDQVTDDQFEALGALLIDVYGAGDDEPSSSFRTRPGNDGGFDFGGVWQSGETCRIISEFDCRIAGQAKNWTSPVPRSQLDSFFSRLQELRRGYIQPPGFSMAWLARQDRPVLGIFLARSGFQSSCVKAARANWTVLIDGDQAAADLVRTDRISTETCLADLTIQLSRYG